MEHSQTLNARPSRRADVDGGVSRARAAPKIDIIPSDAAETLDAVVAWTGEVRARAVSKRWVPGGTLEERRRLAAVGGLAQALLDTQGGNLSPLPPGVLEWLGSPPPPAGVVERVASVLKHGNGPEFLARLYEALIEPANRRVLGTFFTPPTTVEWMLDEWDRSETQPASIVDVGAGVGVYTTAARSRWSSADIWAVDTNPVTLGLLAVLFATSSRSAAVHLVLDDYLKWRPSGMTSSPCLTLGNPPYTRLQLLDKRLRQTLVRTVPHCGSRAGLSTWILADAFSRLGPRDGLLFLLPTNWLEASYSEGLRRALWQAARRRVELTLLRAQLFGDARVDAVSLLVSPEKDAPQPFTLRRDRDDTVVTHESRTGSPPSVAIGSYRRASPILRHSGSRSPLSTFAVVRRGAATGANFYFLLSDDGVNTWKLPGRVLRPVARRLRDFPGEAVTSDAIAALGPSALRWLLLVPAAQHRSTAVKRYIQHGEQLGLDTRHLCRQRTPWYSLDRDVRVPDVIVGAMSTGPFRFLENPAGATITNNLFGLNWRESVERDQRRRVLAWLRRDEGQQALRSIARVQAGGLRKLEPGALSRIHVPDR